MPKKEPVKKSKSKRKKNRKQISKEEKHEESELEREIKEEEKDLKTIQIEEIKREQFTRSTQPSTETFSSSLEKIEPPQQESLEKDLASVPATQEKKDEEPKKYTSVKYTEPDYEDIQREQRRNENLLIDQPSPIMETTRIDLHPQIEQNFQINPELQESRRQSQGNLEKDYVVKVGKFKETKTHSPIEQQERKYKEKVI